MPILMTSQIHLTLKSPTRILHKSCTTTAVNVLISFDSWVLNKKRAYHTKTSSLHINYYYWIFCLFCSKNVNFNLWTFEILKLTHFTDFFWFYESLILSWPFVVKLGKLTDFIVYLLFSPILFYNFFYRSLW